MAEKAAQLWRRQLGQIEILDNFVDDNDAWSSVGSVVELPGQTTRDFDYSDVDSSIGPTWKLDESLVAVELGAQNNRGNDDTSVVASQCDGSSV